MHPHIRLLRSDDIDPIADAFAALGWNKPATQYERYLAQQDAGERLVLVGFVHQAFAGYVTIAWLSEYTPFSVEQIPEIQDFNVLPQYRRRGIGTALMDEAERRIAERSDIVGIGVGLYADYGAAQRMYARRGYVPDGRGIMYDNQAVAPGSQVTVDDSLVLQLTKRLKA